MPVRAACPARTVADDWGFLSRLKGETAALKPCPLFRRTPNVCHQAAPAPEPSRLKGLIQLLAARCTLEKDAVLVPIPSWRRRQRRSFADLIAAGMGIEVRPILRRTRAGVGQHNLNRQQRLANLQGAFCVDNTAVAYNSDHIIWLADDILTTGATAVAARSALEASGHRVAGLICLARTPSPGRD